MNLQKFYFIPVLLVIALLMPISSRAGENISFYSEQNILDFYNYDKTQPFDAEMDTTGMAAINYIINITFTSLHNERVPAKLWMPKWATPEVKAPVIFWLHGYGGNKHIEDAAFWGLSSLNCAFMALDAQYHGDRRESAKAMYSLDLVQDRYAIAQTILDYRRAMDFISQYPQIDTTRIGILGGSMGGIVGAMLAGVDERVKVSVIIVGAGHWSEMLKLSDHETAPALRDYLHGHFSMIDRILMPVDPLTLIHRVSNLQMHNGTEDMTVPYPLAVELFQHAGEPKEFHKYEGHNHESILNDFNASFLLIQRTIRWFQKYL
ncbi:acetylxylan esterase [candidate division KSB1 bacterium]|nr:acetylxylan esterase [candidate division KSB1 bacterium]